MVVVDVEVVMTLILLMFFFRWPWIGPHRLSCPPLLLFAFLPVEQSSTPVTVTSTLAIINSVARQRHHRAFEVSEVQCGGSHGCGGTTTCSQDFQDFFTNEDEGRALDTSDFVGGHRRHLQRVDAAADAHYNDHTPINIEFQTNGSSGGLDVLRISNGR